MTRVLVCGGRTYGKRDGPARRLLNGTLHRLHAERVITAIIHGDAGGACVDNDTDDLITFGADKLGGLWAASVSGIAVHAFPADWKAHGRAAGPIRNARMIDEGKPDLVIAFPGGRGTADMVRQARAAGIEVIEVPS